MRSPSDTPPSSSSSSALANNPNKILHRVSGFFFQHGRKIRTGGDENDAPSEGSSSSAAAVAVENTSVPISRSPSPPLPDMETASRVDSMYSMHSNHSARPVNPNTPPPLRTVCLDNPIIHQSIATEEPPSPVQTSSMARTLPKNTSKLNPNDVDEAFELLLQEYSLPANLRPNLAQLSTEQKSILLQSSKSRMLLHKNSTVSSSSSSSFSLAATLGIHRRSRGHHSIGDRKFFSPEKDDPSSHTVQTISNATSLKSTGTSRGSGHRTLLSTGSNSQGEGSHRTIHSKKSSPEYFVLLLKETPVRELEESEIADLRVFLRTVLASWTTEFLSFGGYEALSDLFRQMKEMPKKRPQDDKILQHLAKCFKAIMTHEPSGTRRVLTNPVGLEHIRDLLFGPANQKQKGVYGLDITTRALFLNILCTLTTLQTKPTDPVSDYVHGYDILRRLLLDRPSDHVGESESTPSKSDLPFRMSLKTDPHAMMKVILENDTEASSSTPRYTAWMREIQYTVDRHIEPITFLAQVLDYKFESAFRQLKLKAQESPSRSMNPTRTDAPEGGSVMVDEGVVDHLITHLRLICTIITTPPTTYRGDYTPREQEKVRLEVMLSGFDKVAKCLRCCPHPTLYDSYIRYLQPLLRPWADLGEISSSYGKQRRSSGFLADTSSNLHTDTYASMPNPPSPPIPEGSTTDPNATFRSGRWVQNSSNDLLSWKNDFNENSLLAEMEPWIHPNDGENDEDDDAFYFDPDSRSHNESRLGVDTLWKDTDLASLDNYDDIFDDDDDDDDMEQIVYQQDSSSPQDKSVAPVFMRDLVT
ncbi:armadillo-type protein [Spinellus fusiger]|nr:armadillo-type protein [Spinellus fusiger]